MEQIRKDRDSIDVKIMARGRLADDVTRESPELAVQLKATARRLDAETSLHFDLPVKNYSDLVKPVLVPRILMLFILPEDEQRWLELSEDALVLRHCAFWTSLRGKPPTTSSVTQRVHLSRQNVVNPETLRELLTRVARQEEL